MKNIKFLKNNLASSLFHSDIKNKKTSKKQKKKNKGFDSSSVDTIFLPREVIEDEPIELDDTEKEIEMFKK